MIIDAIGYELRQCQLDNQTIDKLPENGNHKTDCLINLSPEVTPVFNNIYHIVYNLQQLYCYPHIDRLLLAFKNCDLIWDYSKLNLTYLKEHNFEQKSIYVPLGWSPTYERINSDLIYDQSDCVFVGNLNQLRLNKINHVSHMIKKPIVAFKDTFYGDFNTLLQINQTFINIHFYKNHCVQELPRLIPLIGNDRIVITEKSDDHELDQMVSDYVIWIDDLIENPCLYSYHEKNQKYLSQEFRKKLNFSQFLDSQIQSLRQFCK